MNEDEKLLKILEIEVSRINHLDTILFNIKVWTTTLVIVLIGFVFQLRFDSSSSQGKTGLPEGYELLILAITATLMFFIIDIYFRSIQLKNVQNAREIRRYLKSLSESEKSTIIWKKLWSMELHKRGKWSQWLHDYWYTFIVYGLILTILIFVILY